MGRLEGKVALISGGARGQGATEARRFALEGAKIVIGDLLDTEGQAVAAEIAEAGGDCVYVHLDVTSEDDWRVAVETAVLQFGKLDVLVNNAGILLNGRVEDTTAEAWDAVLDVNAKGVFLGTRAVIGEMRKVGGGSIINISSIAGIVGSPNTTAYNASKGAVRLLTKSTAVQYGREGIRANSIHPGPIDTEMIQAGVAGPEPQPGGDHCEDPAGAHRHGGGHRLRCAVPCVGRVLVHDRQRAGDGRRRNRDLGRRYRRGMGP